jgi:leader peptidase (prepilin peptidase)/N-methyltransferase
MLVFTLAGLFVGSFLNVCIDRFPRGESILSIKSRCYSCGEPLGIVDRIPVLSFLFLRGHCRHCGFQIPVRHLAVEIGTTLLFAVIWLRYPGSWETAIVAFYSSLLIVFLVIDLEKGTILDRVSYPAIAVALLFALWIPERTLPQMLVGGLIAFGTLLAIELLFPARKGKGVAKLATFIGLALGYPDVWVALLLTLVVGVLITGALVLSKRMDHKDPIAIGPFLAMGAIGAMLFGELIVSWGAGGIAQIVRLLSF